MSLVSAEANLGQILKFCTQIQIPHCHLPFHHRFPEIFPIPTLLGVKIQTRCAMVLNLGWTHLDLLGGEGLRGKKTYNL
jgi:hypothetical protein